MWLSYVIQRKETRINKNKLLEDKRLLKDFVQLFLKSNKNSATHTAEIFCPSSTSVL